MSEPTYDDIEVIKIIQKMTRNTDLYSSFYQQDIKNLAVDRLVMLGYGLVESKIFVKNKLISHRTVNARLHLVQRNPGSDKRNIMRVVNRSPVRQVRRWAANYRRQKKIEMMQITR